MSIKKINKEIELLEEKRANVQMLNDLKELKKPRVRSRFDYSFNHTNDIIKLIDLYGINFC